MLILSVDSSATPASVCLFDGNKMIAEYYINTKLTHSQTLGSMIESALGVTGVKANDIDYYAVNNGPGSFTGVRIGVSLIKGMAYAANKPCIAVSTLESMAYNFLSCDAVICACMDARRQQVYNALFRISDGKVERLCNDRPISIAELSDELETIGERMILVGDGAELVYDSVKNMNNIELAPHSQRFQRASSTALIAAEKAVLGEYIEPSALMPTYLRLSQAERERQAKAQGDV